MSIKDRQVKKVSDELLASELSAGRFPDAAVIERKVNQALTGRSLGNPKYLFKEVKENELSNPDDYNNGLLSIHEDLHIVFDEVGQQNDSLIGMANMYETEKRLLGVQLKKLQSRIQKLGDKLHNRYSQQVIHESFHTFNHVDLTETSAFVDLERNQVTLNTVTTGSLQYDLSSANYKVQTIEAAAKFEAAEELPFQNALRDTVNESWRYVVTQDVTSPVVVDVMVSLPEKIEANRLSLELHSPKQTDVTLFISEDGVVWKEYKTLTSYDKVEWMFSQSISGIKFRFKKNEPDFVTGTVMEYYFGVKRVSVRKESYLKENQLVSQPFPTDIRTLDKVRLEVKEIVYPQTAIRYYVGMDGDEQFTEWQEITPNQSIKLNQLAHEKVMIQSTQTGYGEQAGENFGLSFYNLASLKYSPIPKRSQLFMGDYMWKVESKSIPALTEEYIPSLQDWHDVKGVTTAFLPIEETYDQKEWQLSEGCIQRFTTHVYCEKEEEIYNAEFSIGNANLQVYVNNNLIKPVVIPGEPVRYKYNYRFQAGWNRIEILTYAANPAPFKPNLYLKDISTKVFAVKDSLKEVSPYDLYNNTSKKDIGYFAIEDQKVIVNYNPIGLDQTGRGIRYTLEYDYVPVGTRLTHAVRFMAILSRQEQSDQITPVLKEYKLILE